MLAIEGTGTYRAALTRQIKVAKDVASRPQRGDDWVKGFLRTAARSPVWAPATRHTLRLDARRWQLLNAECKTHEARLGEPLRQLVLRLVDAIRVGADTAAKVLIVADDNIDWSTPRTALARHCGIATIPPPPA
jgi:hypothetical protein